MSTVTLRPYQQAFLDRWSKLPKPRRLFLAWDMGAGKTMAALHAAKAEGAQKVLIVCPALVRPQWVREALAHLPGRTAAAIEISANTNSASAKARAARELATQANVQVVSYDLVASLPATAWDFVIIDEFHALRSLASKQSKSIRKLFELHPNVPALGLSGTPIPNEAKQLWNPVDIFFPGVWGQQARKGYEPFAFVNRFCHKEVNEYGTKYVGLREEARAELADRFARISDRVVQQDFAQYLPPLYVEPLEVKQPGKPFIVLQNWLDNLPHDVQHIGVYCHLRATAAALFDAIPAANSRSAFLLTGESNAEHRDRILRVAAASERSVIVGTTHALAEGVSLSFQKAALVVEWTSDVSAVLQFLGRFSRQDSTSMAPTRVSVAIGPNDISAAQIVRERVANINHVIRASRGTDAAASAFAERQMSDDDFFSQLQSMAVSHERRTQLWSAEDDENDDD